MSKVKIEEMKKIEIIIGKILRIGVAISVVTIFIGILFYYFNGNSGYVGNYFPTSMSGIISGVLAGKANAILMLGLLLLIFTPVLRVVISIYAFFKEGDNLYTLITTIVLIILIIALIIGFNK